jgi:hypothetical protein
MSLTTEQMKFRLGKFTASNIEAICKPKGLGETGLSYIESKAAEILTGECETSSQNAAMQWGIDNEPNALAHFESVKKVKLKKSESIIKNMIVGTPDALGKNYGVEIKCPESKKHVRYLSMENGNSLKTINPVYWWQIQCYMFLTGFNFWYFVSYDPRIRVPEKVMGIFKIERNQEDINLLIERVNLATEILQKIVL